MRFYQTVVLTLVVLSLAACTSNPNAPINQTFPIRQMDQFFNSVGTPDAPPPPPPPDYTHEPGYAPAYPPY